MDYIARVTPSMCRWCPALKIRRGCLAIRKSVIGFIFSVLLLLPVAAFADNQPPQQAILASNQSAAVSAPATKEKESVKAQDQDSDDDEDADDDDTPDDVEESPADFIKSVDTLVVPAPGAPAPLADAKAGVTCPAAAALASQPAPAADPDSAQFNLFGTSSPDSVDKNVRYFSSTIKGHFTRWLARSGKYLGMMKSIFRENYLPEDLVFLALIESGFNPKAYSWARASGPWQFIRGTGQRYGLKIDRWVDERRDPVKSTKAAAAYLKDLYGMFGSWPLAMASYNAGEGNVARAVNRNGTDDFWELRKTRGLPSETKEYVPKFLAAKMIAQDPGKFGFDSLEYERPFEYDEVVLDRCTDLAVVAKCCGVPVSDIKELNPELIRWCTPPNSQSYTLRIPKGSKEEFLASYANLSDEEKSARPRHEDMYDHYTVRRGDTLKKIARRFHTTESLLASANGLEPGSRVKRGQRLSLPNSVASDDSRPRRGGRSKSGSYKVRKGDTLSSIASSRGISASRLAAMNGISTKTRLRPGQRLKLSSGTRVARSKHGRKKTYTVRKNEDKEAA